MANAYRPPIKNLVMYWSPESAATSRWQACQSVLCSHACMPEASLPGDHGQVNQVPDVALGVVAAKQDLAGGLGGGVRGQPDAEQGLVQHAALQHAEERRHLPLL